MKAILLLEDGTHFEGTGFGAAGEAFGEVVFNTSMTGYQEILTDPSYRGQIVSMTFPQIGNYGVNEDDRESRRTWLSGFVVKELSTVASSWRATGDLGSFLAAGGVVGIQGIDTRALTRHLRIGGAKHGVVSTSDLDLASLARKLAAAPRIVGVDLVREVTCAEPYAWTEPAEGVPATAAVPGSTRRHVVVLDCGVKYNILRHLVSTGFRVTVVPAATSADADPRPETGRRSALERSGRPRAGHVRRGDGARPHRAGPPVRDLPRAPDARPRPRGPHVQAEVRPPRGQSPREGPRDRPHRHHVAEPRVQRGHGVARSPGRAPPTSTSTTARTEGLEDTSRALFGVQYHPEAGPGPHDADRLFARFADLVAAGRR